jgi:hypothetical protein
MTIAGEDPQRDALAGRLSQHVRRLAVEIGERNVSRPAGLTAAAGYIEEIWERQGLAVERQSYVVHGIECCNLTVTCTGTVKPEQIVLVGAHYDSVTGSPGANDNASGVAALLEISRVLAALRLQRTVRCVAFVNEEPPYFYTRLQGSWQYARAARERGDDIRLMIALETIGYFRDEPGSQAYPPLFRYFYPDRADFIAFVSNLRSRRGLRRFRDAFSSVSDFPLQCVATPVWIPGVAWSDHLSFWRHGYRALMVTDTAFYRYPHYHTGNDLPEHLDFQRLARLTEGLAGAVARLAAGTD